MEIISTLQSEDIGHNMFFTKNEIFIFPRINEYSNFDQSKIGVATMEFSGKFLLLFCFLGRGGGGGE